MTPKDIKTIFSGSFGAKSSADKRVLGFMSHILVVTESITKKVMCRLAVGGGLNMSSTCKSWQVDPFFSSSHTDDFLE